MEDSTVPAKPASQPIALPAPRLCPPLSPPPSFSRRRPASWLQSPRLPGPLAGARHMARSLKLIPSSPFQPSSPGLPHSGPLAPDRPSSPLTLGSATGLVGAWRGVVHAGALLTFAHEAPTPGPLLPAGQDPVRSSQNRHHSYPAFCLQKNLVKK